MTACTPSSARCRPPRPWPGVKLRLVAVNNDILGEAITDADGHVRFDPGPRARHRRHGAADRRCADRRRRLRLHRPVGRRPSTCPTAASTAVPAPAPLDVFLTPERGIYRPGETIHLTALVRDARANAVDRPAADAGRRAAGRRRVRPRDALRRRARRLLRRRRARRPTPCAARGGQALCRPQGRRRSRETSRARRGFRARAARFRPRPPTATCVEPGRAGDDRSHRALSLRRAGARPLGRRRRRPQAGRPRSPAFPGYSFGLADETVEADREPFDYGRGHRRRRQGDASTSALPELPETTRPLEAADHRPHRRHQWPRVERNLTLPVKPADADDRHQAALRRRRGRRERRRPLRGDPRRVPTATRVAAPGLTWKLERINTDYQWYRSDGNWNYELMTTNASGSTTGDDRRERRRRR